MRVAAAAMMFLCSIATVSAQEPTGAPSDEAQRTCVFAGENYSEGAEFCVASHAGLKCESGKWSRDTQLECGSETGGQRTMSYEGPCNGDHMGHMDHIDNQ